MTKYTKENMQKALKYLDSWFEVNIRTGQTVGLQVAIWHNNKVVYSKAFGHANIETGEKLTPDHQMRIASHSKTFTATAIMQLFEAGKLGLDDKVVKYLNWFKSSTDPRVELVTIRQLLSHSSGIIRDGDDADYWQLLRDFPSRDELINYISTSRLVLNSDEKFKYSNFGFGILGIVVETASGQSYEQYIAEHILKPLNLKDTVVDGDGKESDRLATGYGNLRGGKRTALQSATISTGSLASATGFVSTASDLVQFFAAQMPENTKLLSDQTKRYMQHGGWNTRSDGELYGFGMIEQDIKGNTIHGHSGGFPGFLSNTIVDNKNKLAICVITNSYGVNLDHISASIAKLITSFNETNETKLPKDVTNLEHFQFERYSLFGPTNIVLAGGKLRLHYPSGWYSFSDKLNLEVIDANTLKLTGDDGYGDDGELIKYAFDEDSKINKVIATGSSLLTLEEARKVGWTN